MIIWIILGVNIWLAGIALTNLILAPKLKTVPGKSEPEEDDISVLIPCRNEEENIGLLLNDLKKTERGIREILVYDDLSADRSIQIVEQSIRKDTRIRLIQGKEKPEKWLGKQYGCYRLSEEATGRYMLFLDADVRISPEGFDALSKTMRSHQYDLLTVFPTQICLTRGEQLVVPVMNRVLLTLLPLILMRQKYFSSLSAANGQVMFFKAHTYHRYQFHKLFRKEAAEDMAIVRFMKTEKLNAICYLANGLIQCRMYKNYTACMEGFSKNVVTFFGKSYLAGFVYALTGILSYVTIGYIKGADWLLLVLLLIHLLTETAVAKASSTNAVRSILHYPLRGCVLTLLLWKSLKNKQNNNLIWKGRNISY